MNWREHIAQADLLLREAAEDSAIHQSTEHLLRVLIAVNSAQAHAALADLKRREE